jgi:hypothetical protein
VSAHDSRAASCASSEKITASESVGHLESICVGAPIVLRERIRAVGYQGYRQPRFPNIPRWTAHEVKRCLVR